MLSYSLFGSLFLLLAATVKVPGVAQVQAADIPTTDCVDEFGSCVISRDCCAGLSCVSGEWQYTTDSTCLSERSAQLEAQHFSMEERLAMVTAYYEQVFDGSNAKSSQQLEDLVQKKYRSEFPKLVSKLERKYDKPFTVFHAATSTGNANGVDEL